MVLYSLQISGTHWSLNLTTRRPRVLRNDSENTLVKKTLKKDLFIEPFLVHQAIFYFSKTLKGKVFNYSIS